MFIPEALKKVLTEEQINEIKAEFDKQVEIKVESALHQYDDDALVQINKLEAQINENHARKLKGIITKYNNLLESIKAKHNSELNEEAEKFKVRLAEQVENFINNKINSIVSFDTIKESARNKAANIVLESLRKQLGVDSALMKESVRKPISKAKNSLNEAISYIKKLKAENTALNESLNSSKANLLIESKVANLDNKSADHMRRMLTGKDVKFINEQFDYIYGLYQEGQESRREAIRKEALKARNKKSSNIESRRISDLMTESKSQVDSSDAKLIDDIVNEMNQEF